MVLFRGTTEVKLLDGRRCDIGRIKSAYGHELRDCTASYIYTEFERTINNENIFETFLLWAREQPGCNEGEEYVWVTLLLLEAASRRNQSWQDTLAFIKEHPDEVQRLFFGYRIEEGATA